MVYSSLDDPVSSRRCREGTGIYSHATSRNASPAPRRLDPLPVHLAASSTAIPGLRKNAFSTRFLSRVSVYGQKVNLWTNLVLQIDRDIIVRE